jgi:hypothetical protein
LPQNSFIAEFVYRKRIAELAKTYGPDLCGT